MRPPVPLPHRVRPLRCLLDRLRGSAFPALSSICFSSGAVPRSLPLGVLPLASGAILFAKELQMSQRFRSSSKVLLTESLETS